MEMLETALGKWLFQIIITLVFLALFWWIIKSAQESLKRSNGKWISVIDEVIYGLVGIAIYLIIISAGPVAILTKIQTIWFFLWGELIAPFLRDILRLPV